MKKDKAFPNRGLYLTLFLNAPIGDEIMDNVTHVHEH